MPTIKNHLPDRHCARGMVSALERQLHNVGRKIADFIRDPASPSPGVIGLVRFWPQMCVNCCARAAKHPTPVPGQLAQDYSGLFHDNLSTVYIILMICLWGFLGNPPFNSPSFDSRLNPQALLQESVNLTSTAMASKAPHVNEGAASVK